MLLPALARAKAKANRVKCVNNLSTINKALSDFAHDNENDLRLPWQLLYIQAAHHFGDAARFDRNSKSVGYILAVSAVRNALSSPKSLLSPCDPTRAQANEVAESSWHTYSASGTPIPADAISYVLIEGADVQRPTTILATTRNLSDCDLNGATWVGSDDYPDGATTMAGLTAGQGQLTLMDGSAKQSSNADIGKDGLLITAHINSSGGHSSGSASAGVYGCTVAAGVILVAPGGKNGGWDDISGYAKLDGYILENTAGKFEVIEKKLTWFQATADAESRGSGSHLATITSQAEWTEMLATPGFRSALWLGGWQPNGGPNEGDPKGGWEWITGEPWGQVDGWDSSAGKGFEPNNGGGNQHCLETWYLR